MVDLHMFLKGILSSFCFIFVFCFFSYKVQATSLNARSVMKQNEVNRSLDTVKARGVLKTGKKGKKTRIKTFSWWRKLRKDHVHFKTLIRFWSPPSIRNEGLLFLEHSVGEKEILLYLPRYRKIRRVERSKQKGRFMGSEFSYSDMTFYHMEDYKYRFLRKEPCPKEDEKNSKKNILNKDQKIFCYVIEAKPKTEKILEQTGYQKIIHWIHEKNFMNVKVEYYNESGEKFKVLFASKITEVDSKKHKWMAYGLHMKNLKTGRFSMVRFDSVKANQLIPSSFFTRSYLKMEP